MRKFCYLTVLLTILSGCTSSDQQTMILKQCTDCHAVQQDVHHQQLCTSCHGGNNSAVDKRAAHINLEPTPSHPDSFSKYCGACHSNIIDNITQTLHFTLSDSINLFRKSFGAEETLSDFLKTPEISEPETPLQLADNLLRRRCYRCHPYNSGDNYPAVSHGTGCASCHMSFSEGKPVSHFLERPGDAQCLSCHYGNYVGFDYYGRFEHDLNIEYRTPFTTKNNFFRPFGVEYHQLQPDIHQTRGMLCIDCHRGSELMEDIGKKPTCGGCHDLEELRRSLPALVVAQEDSFILKGRNGKDHPIPLLQHPAHGQQSDRISCQACHAQWTFNDFGKHYLRSDTEDFDLWSNLAIQGDFEIETIVENNNDYEKNELPAQMTDKISGKPKVGLWYKGFSRRRWEHVQLGRDNDGNITTMRPLLDYYISWIDEEENVRFDSVVSQVSNKGLYPYVPHTTGPAGLFYLQRIEAFLASEKSDEKQSFSQPHINIEK